jgi:hypothetical protein
MAFASNIITIDADAETAMHEDRDWTAYTKGLLRAEMVKRNLSYRDLVEKLASMGLRETEANLRNKISRGGFTGTFLIQCLAAMGIKEIRLHDIE